MLGFNVIKVIMDAQKDTEALVKMFSMLLHQTLAHRILTIFPTFW